MNIRRLIPVLLLLMIVPMLSGCTRTVQTASPQPDENGRGAAQQADVELGEWFVRIDPNPVRAGTVQFNIRNVGERIHSLEIENGGIEEVSRTLRAGESTTMTIDLPAGEYDAYCPIGDHRQRGMETTLVVE